TLVMYDTLGRPTVIYQPFSAGINGYETRSYDPLGRVTGNTLYRSGGEFDRLTTTAYSGRSVLQIGPLLHVSKRIFDVAGLLRRVVDPAPGGTTSYDYDVFGNLNKIVDSIGAQSTATYNLRGFKTQTLDADAGTWNFYPDSLNELVAWQD